MTDVRFAIVTDGHWGGQISDWEQKHDETLANIESVHSNQPIDFLVHDGDLVDGSGEVDDVDQAHQEVITNFLSELPFNEYYAVQGNHDSNHSQTGSYWEDTFGHPKDHTFTKSGYGFYVVDPQGSGWDTPPASHVESVLDDLSHTDGVFVFQHVAPFDDTDWAGDDNPDLREQYARDDVLAVFLGHEHNKNFRESREDPTGQRYYYCSRGAAADHNDDSSFEDIDELGFRLVEVSAIE